MNFLSSRFPRIYAVLNQMKVGSIRLVKDAKLRYTLKLEKGKMYTPTQLVTHKEFGADVRKCLPVFVIFWIPVIGMWISLPMVLLFPHQTLSRQFWTDKQRTLALNRVLEHRAKLFPSLSLNVMNAIEHSQADSKLSQLSCDILEKIGQGDLLKEEESHILRRIFVEAKTLHPKALTSNHLKDLSISTSSYDLRNHAIYIANVDRSLRHFGIDAEDMYTTDIIAHQRGGWLDSTDQKRSLTYIQQWLDFSKGFKSKEAELGYLLHLPLFMRNNTSTETK